MKCVHCKEEKELNGLGECFLCEVLREDYENEMHLQVLREEEAQNRYNYERGDYPY